MVSTESLHSGSSRDTIATARVRPLENQSEEYTDAHYLPENKADLLKPALSRAERVRFPALSAREHRIKAVIAVAGGYNIGDTF